MVVFRSSTSLSWGFLALSDGPSSSVNSNGSDGGSAVVSVLAAVGTLKDSDREEHHFDLRVSRIGT